MEKKRKTRINDDLSTFILLSLLKEGELTLKELQAHTALQSIQFDSHHNKRHEKIQKHTDLAETCDGLICKKWLKLTDQAKYRLTEEGKAQAEVNAKAIERGAALLQNQVLSPSVTARNTTVGYVFLAVIKLLAGFFSGSVGLIADGADTTVDTVASGVVWFGIRLKREIVGTLLIIGLIDLRRY